MIFGAGDDRPLGERDVEIRSEGDDKSPRLRFRWIVFTVKSLAAVTSRRAARLILLGILFAPFSSSSGGIVGIESWADCRVRVGNLVLIGVVISPSSSDEMRMGESALNPEGPRGCAFGGLPTRRASGASWGLTGKNFKVSLGARTISASLDKLASCCIVKWGETASVVSYLAKWLSKRSRRLEISMTGRAMTEREWTKMCEGVKSL